MKETGLVKVVKLYFLSDNHIFCLKQFSGISVNEKMKA